jgi:hypothetical protein
MDSNISIDTVASSISKLFGVNLLDKNTPQLAIRRTKVLIEYKHPNLADVLDLQNYFVTSVYNVGNFKSDPLVIIDLQSKNTYKDWKDFYEHSERLLHKFIDIPDEDWHLC